ncbi:MAG: PAS domain S-box protein, partial [Aquihabitans sp.]
MTRLRWAAIAASAVIVLIAAIIPASQVPLLVGSALLAAVACRVAAVRASGVDRTAWSLFAVAAVLNGLGNLGFASSAPSWIQSGGWLTDSAFTLAVVIVVVGLFALIAPTDAANEVWRVGLDLLIMVGACFAVGWHWDVPQAMGLSAEGSVVDLIRFLSVIVGLGGIILTRIVWQSRPPGQQLAVRLAAAALTVSVLGDIQPLRDGAGIQDDVATAAWVLSSCLFLVGALFVPTVPRRSRWLGRSRSIDMATVTVGISLLALVGRGGTDVVTEVLVALVVLLLLIRQMRMLHLNMDLAQALRESEAHFRTLVDDTSDVIMRVSHDAVIEYASRASLPVLGCPGADLVGRSLAELVGPQERQRLLDWLLSDKGSGSRFEVEITPKGGRRRVVSLMGSPTATGKVLSIREITRQVELRRQLEA